VILTGKVFEYLATQRPIIGVGPVDGNASQLLADCARPAMIDYEDKTEIKNRISSLYMKYLADSTPTSEGNLAHRAYTRENVTKELSHLLDSFI
jgi:hypothetical protein